MLYQVFAVAASLVAGTAAQMGCLTPAASKNDMSRIGSLSNDGSAPAALSARATTYVDTYVHIVSRSTSESDGYLSQDTIDEQMAVLNNDFSGTGFQFVLQDTDYTVNQYWASNQDISNMKNTLRRGTYQALNLYYITDIGNGNTGYCTYPTDASPGSGTVANDGCVISAWTTPGGVQPGTTSTTFSTGKITTHEVGHWSSLIHTFEGNNCNGQGDLVSDTPAQSGPSSGCMTGRDSCPSLPGLDPIHNHMDYSDDSCRNQFTQGQVSRMQSAWDSYRA